MAEPGNGGGPCVWEDDDGIYRALVVFAYHVRLLDKQTGTGKQLKPQDPRKHYETSQALSNRGLYAEALDEALIARRAGYPVSEDYIDRLNYEQVMAEEIRAAGPPEYDNQGNPYGHPNYGDDW
jgi:hypothetical protein